MNKIIINNQEFEETSEIYPISDGLWYQNKWYKPVKRYKAGDWVIYKLTETRDITRKLISESEYKNTIIVEELNQKYGKDNWMTEGASVEWIQYIKRKATESEIKQHLSNLAKEKGLVKGAKVKRISVLDNTTTNIVQEDDDYYIEQDEYCKSGIILYSNGKWVEKIEEPKFTFGGHEVSFKVIDALPKIVEVTCKGETGTHWQIKGILRNYFRPCKFGNVEVKNFDLHKKYYDDALPTIEVGKDLNFINTITIGCLTGTYKELNDIYSHCLELLEKNQDE